MIQIRKEAPNEAEAIRQVHLQAFEWPAESKLVDLLRERELSSVSLVAVEQGQIVGHVQFSPVTIEPPQSIRALGMGPVGIKPEFQGQHIGSQLIHAGLNACRQEGWEFVVVLGDPGYYTRFGFTRALDFGLQNDYGAHEEFMVQELKPGVLAGVSGTIHYCPEFSEAGC